MNIEEMREEFEAWSANHDYFGGVEVDIAISGNYSDVDMQHAWEVWQASRAAIEVELPKIIDKEWANTHAERSAMREAIEWCKKRIEAAGLKVKS